LKEPRLFRINRPSLTATNLVRCLVLASVATAVAFAQTSPAFFPNQEIRVANLPSMTSPSADTSAVIATALEAILHNKDLCCGKYSGLENDVFSAAPSLKALSAKLQGRHVLGDGLSVVVRTEYVPKSSIGSATVIRTLLHQQPMLLKWKSHVYVLYGAIFDESRDDDGTRQFLIHKLLLLDLRYSDRRREAEFNRDTDDWGTLQGLLTVSVAQP
jgi:hypothetical protein